MTPPAESARPGWVVVVPVKHGDVAKSRLAGVTAEQRADLARAFPADCAEAALAADAVGHVVVVTDDPLAADTVRGLGAEVIPDEPDAGLNPALQHALAHARRRYAVHPLAVLSGDLPALRPAELSMALERAGGLQRAFLADRAGDGTTLLAAAPGVDLGPRFGVRSRLEHLSSGASEIEPAGLDTVRRDVDTWADLQDAMRLGVGRHTSVVLNRHGLTLD